MARLGFDRRTGLIYEGVADPTHPVWPTPTLSQATLIEKPEDLAQLPSAFDSSPFGWTFVDGSFDPGSRYGAAGCFKNLVTLGGRWCKSRPICNQF